MYVCMYVCMYVLYTFHRVIPETPEMGRPRKRQILSSSSGGESSHETDKEKEKKRKRRRRRRRGSGPRRSEFGLPGPSNYPPLEPLATSTQNKGLGGAGSLQTFSEISTISTSTHQEASSK